jgi:hypothetical protein
MSFIVLYQEITPAPYQHALCKIKQSALPTKRYTVFPCTEAGLREAVNEAAGQCTAWIASFTNLIAPPEICDELIREVEEKVQMGYARRVK